MTGPCAADHVGSRCKGRLGWLATVSKVTDLASVALHDVDIDEARRRDAFLRWGVHDASVRGCWGLGSSVALVHDRAPRPRLPGPWAILLGRPDELRLLIDAVPGLIGETPLGVTMSAAAYHLVPASWGLATRGHWDYMVTSVAPAAPMGLRIDVVEDHDQLHAVLDADNPDAHARPGDDDVHSWLGIADDEGMACVGALAVSQNGGAHLRAITTLARARGRGYGAALSAALTRRGLEQISSEVTLGVYSDNAGAIRLYERLGYRLVHHFTSAAAPARRDAGDGC